MTPAPPNPKILIVLNWDESERFGYQSLIRQRFPELRVVTVTGGEEARREIVDADIVMAFGVHLPRGIFEHAGRLRWVHAFGTGVDGIADQPFLSDDVAITATRGIHGPPMSELALLLMLALVRDFPRTVRAQMRGEWERWRVGLVNRKTVGIVGVGRIAEDLAPKCQAMGMRVVGFSRSARAAPGFDRLHPREDLVRLAAELDFLVLLIPYSGSSHNIVDDAVLGAMKPTAYLINIARAGVLDEDALLRALQSETIAGAALDVMQTEPLPRQHPLWSQRNLIITPHLGGYYDAYVADSIEQICGNLQYFLDGRPDQLKNKIDR